MNKKNTVTLIICVVFVAFSLNGVLIFLVVQNNLEDQTEDFLKANLNAIVSLIDLNRKETMKKVRYDINVANFIFYNKYLLEETNDYMIFNAKNQITGQEEKVQVNKWLLNGKQLQNNYNFVDEVKNMIGSTSTIFQKIEKGFVRISTNVPTKELGRAVGTYISNDSPVIKTILKGQRYYGRAYVVNDWYLTAYEPIWLNGEIKGMLYVGVKEKEFENLRKKLADINIGKSGYIVILDSEGKAIIHPTHEDKDIRNYDLVKRVKKEKKGILYYRFEEKKKIAAVEYYKHFDWYVLITINRYELVQDFLSALEIVTILFSLFLSSIMVLILTKIIKKHEIFLTTLIETIPTPVFYKNRNRIFQGCNYAFEKFINMEKSDIVGKHIYNLTDPETANALSNVDEAVMNDSNCRNYELELISGNKSAKQHVIISSAVYPDKKNVEGFIGVITDITKLKEQQIYLKKVSIHDALTGLYNRHGMRDMQVRIFKDAIRKKQHLSVIMADIDYFKKYNDTYGHREGDKCLKKVAGTLLSNINRPLDIGIRYGGEEFLLILPNTFSSSALKIARRIRTAIIELAIEHKGSSYGIVTISQGIYSGVPSANEKLENFIVMADRMLYHVKEKGRNAICKTAKK